MEFLSACAKRTSSCVTSASKIFQTLSEDVREVASTYYIGNNELPIHIFAGYGQPGELRTLLKYTSIEAKSRTHLTPLHYATLHRNAKNVRYLLINGAKIAPTTILASIQNGDAKCFAYLLKGNPSLDDKVPYFGGDVSLHDLIASSPLRMIRASVKHLVETSSQLMECVVGRYLSRFILSGDYEAVIGILDLGVYGKDCDTRTIATAMFATFSNITSSDVSGWVDRIVKNGLAESLEIVLSQHPDMVVCALFQDFERMMRSGRSCEMMLTIMSIDPYILEYRGNGFFRKAWVYAIEGAEGHAEYERRHIEKRLYTKPERQRIKVELDARLEDIAELKWVVYASCACANVYGLPGPKERFHRPLGIPPLFDMILLNLRLDKYRKRHHLIKESVRDAREKCQWRPILEAFE